MSGYGGGGRGRGGRGRGRGGYNSGRGGGRSHGHHGGPKDTGTPARFRPCFNWTTTGACQNQNCGFHHIVKMHASIDASPQAGSGPNNAFNSNKNNKSAVSSVAIWETQNVIKIFTGSHDGFWRLWNTSGGAFVKEFEHSMGGGKVECLEVASNFLFCGFEGTSIKLPAVTVGMIHSWNLNAPADAPLEFHMDPLAPYAHSKGVTSLISVGDMIVSGAHDGVIRLWKYDSTNRGFALQNVMHGHAGEITGLALVGTAGTGTGTMLWSASIDSSIRLWDVANNGKCQHLITRDTAGRVGHTAAVTCLIPFDGGQAGNFVLSSSLDGTVKAWNGSNGECVATEPHGEGVVTIALSADLKGNPLLLAGLERGNIMVRSVLQTPNAPAFCLLFTLSSKYTAGHDGPVKALTAGPASTFYSGGSDGKLLVWQITGDLGL